MLILATVKTRPRLTRIRDGRPLLAFHATAPGGERSVGFAVRLRGSLALPAVRVLDPGTTSALVGQFRGRVFYAKSAHVTVPLRWRCRIVRAAA